MASESKKPRVDKSEEDSSNIVAVRRAGIVKDDLYILPLGAQIDFMIKSCLTDATFVIEGKKIYAGRDFLSVLSPFFNALLNGGFVESKKDEIELKDVSYDEFNSMLQYLSVPLRQIEAEDVESMLILGDRYDIKWLVDRAEEFLISTNELSFSQKLLLADRFRLVKLQVTCFRLYRDGDLRKQVESSEEYAQLSNSAKAYMPFPISEFPHMVEQEEEVEEEEGEEEEEDNEEENEDYALNLYRNELEVEKVEEPVDGFIALGTMSVEDRRFNEHDVKTLDLAGVIWEFEVDRTYDGDIPYKCPNLSINKLQLSSSHWSVEGFVEVTMTVLNLENGKELRRMEKTYPLTVDRWDVMRRMNKLMAEMRHTDAEFDAAREFVDMTIYITRTSGLRPTPNFDFTVPSELTDVAFIVEGRKVHVNRQYLAVISSRFFEMFYDSDEVEVKNVEYKDFIQFLHWIYPSQRRYLTASWMFSTLKIARQLGIEIDTSVIEKYLSVENVNALYLERMIFFFEFNIGDKKKLKEGDWYGLREENYHDHPTKLPAAFFLLQKCPLFAKMTPVRKNDLYEWMLKAEYDP